MEDKMEEAEGQVSEDCPSPVNNICVEYISVYIFSSIAANMLLPQRTWAPLETEPNYKGADKAGTAYAGTRGVLPPEASVRAQGV